MANPDMSEALMAEEPELDDMFAGAEDAGEEGLDPLFSAEAKALFPEFDDTQLQALQALIDARCAAHYEAPDEMPLPAEPDEL